MWVTAVAIVVFSFFAAGAQPQTSPAEAAAAHVERGIELAHREDFSAAAAEFLAALKSDPALAEAHYLLGLVRQNWGKLNDARASYQAALKLNPNYAEAQLGLAAVLARQAKMREVAPETAIEACRKAAALNPKEAEPHVNLGDLVLETGPSAAAQEYSAALELDPGNIAARKGLASALVKQNDFERAVPLLRGLVAGEPRNAALRHQLGAALGKAGDSKAAVEELREAARLDPGNAQVHYVFATNLRKLGLTDEAGKEMALFRQSGDERQARMQARYHLGLGQQLAAGGKLAEAIPEYRQALSFRYDVAVATDLAVLLLRTGNPGDAIQALQEACERQPGYALAHYHLGMAYGGRRQYGRAREEFLAALRLRPQFPEALFNLGMTYVAEDRLEQAEEQLRASVRLRPDAAASRYYLGVVLERQGKKREAEGEFQAARQLDPAFRPE